MAGRGEVVPRVAELDVPDGEDVAAVAHDARPREQRPEPDCAVFGTAEEERAIWNDAASFSSIIQGPLKINTFHWSNPH